MRTELHDQVQREAELIPKGDLAQQLFRMAFVVLRENSLGKTPEEHLTAHRVVERAAASVRRSHPDFQPHYDARLLAC